MLAVPCEVTTLPPGCFEGVTAMMVRFMALLGALLIALDPAHADQVLVCTPRSGGRAPTTLLIKGAPYTPTEIVWPGWGQDGVRKFTIKSYSDANYTALRAGRQRRGHGRTDLCQSAGRPAHAREPHHPRGTSDPGQALRRRDHARRLLEAAGEPARRPPVDMLCSGGEAADGMRALEARQQSVVDVRL